MQPLTWYLRRLQGMSFGEVAWRVRSTLIDAVDRHRFRFELYPSAQYRDVNPHAVPIEPGFPVSDLSIGEWASPERTATEAAWLERLIAQADRIAEHRLTFFNLRDRHLGDPIDWNRDHESKQATPLDFAPAIDYRDYAVTGDAKLVWEPNRHHHLVILGRAYRASGDRRYAEAIVEQLASWIQQCPFGYGMNWRSPLELGIRLINWVWAIDLIRESGAIAGALRSRILDTVSLHLWEITRKYSRGSSANNHLIGEAAGVFIATCYFTEFSGVEKWRDHSRAILSREISAQTYPQGCTREQAFGYHLFVLQFFLLAGIVARRTNRDFPAEYWARLEKMLEFAGALLEGGDVVPMFGDSDDGYVLDLGDSRGTGRGLLAVGAVLFQRPEFKARAGGYSETARWLLGRTSRAEHDALEATPPHQPLSSQAFSDSGHYLLQSGRAGAPDCFSVLFDCGELGFTSLAAHGHADALSFTLRAFGIEVFVDPGTFDYFTYPAIRKYFRSTRAHNTVVIDDTDQSTMLGPFLWGSRAESRCILWDARPDGATVLGEHNGYLRLKDPVVHRRTLSLDGNASALTICDEIQAKDEHGVQLFFHVSNLCDVSEARTNCFRLKRHDRSLTLEIDPRLSARSFSQSENPIAGWMSSGYHQKTECTTLVCSGRFRGDVTLVCRIALDHASTA